MGSEIKQRARMHMSMTHGRRQQAARAGAGAGAARERSVGGEGDAGNTLNSKEFKLKKKHTRRNSKVML